MKTTTTSTGLGLILGIGASLTTSLASATVVFTNNTTIGIQDTTYDGQDVVIAGPCMLTVDGARGFASLLVQSGGILTHTASANGSIDDVFTVTNEPHVLNSTNPVTLNQLIVVADTIVVTSVPAGTTYVLGTDYQVITTPAGGASIGRLPGSSIPDGGSVAEGFWLNSGPGSVWSNYFVSP